jgi:hypothetical protein
VAMMHSVRYQQALWRYQAHKIRRRDFNEGDLVLRLRQDNRGHHHRHGRGPTSSSRCSSPAHTSLRTSKVKSSPTLGTSNNYVAFTLKKFQVNLRVSDTPVGCIYVKFMNKVKGDSVFSPKTKSPSGATTGGAPLNGLVFFTKIVILKMPSTSQPGSLGKKKQGASSQKVKTGEPGTAHASGGIRLLPLTTLPTGHS